MPASVWPMTALLFFLTGGEPPANPWREKVGPAVESARRLGRAGAYLQALDAAWRADDWQVGRELAREALEKFAGDPRLRAPAARALWRAGDVHGAERLAARLPHDAKDPLTLRVLISVNLARGDEDAAGRAAARLEALPPRTAEDWFHVIAARWALNRLDDVAPLVRRAQRLIDADNGYPEMHLGEQLDGLAEFFDAVGAAPVNQIVAHGATPMPPLPLLNLPACQAMINGRGPYRLIVDTGGSILLSLDEAVAEEIGLKVIASSSVRGIGGRQTAGQALVETLQLGPITCRRVVTRTFGVRQAIAHAADGILGTGIFGEARLTLDLQSGQLRVAPSSERPAAGTAAELRLVGDAKPMVLLELDGAPAVALLDSGADAIAVSPSRLRRLFPDQDIQTVSGPILGIGAGRRPTLSLTPGVDFTLAGRKFENYGGLGIDVLDTLLSPLLGLQTDLLIGMPIMRQMKTLTIDFPRTRMWIEWLEGE